MHRRDIEAELSVTGAQELLASTSARHLAYVGKDGTPRVIPVGYYWTGEEFVVATATTAPKVAALRVRPDVALTIDAGHTPDQARTLSVLGRATVEIIDGVVPEYLAAARETMDPQSAAEFERNVRAMYRQMVRIGITRIGFDFTISVPAACRDSSGSSLSRTVPDVRGSPSGTPIHSTIGIGRYSQAPRHPLELSLSEGAPNERSTVCPLPTESLKAREQEIPWASWSGVGGQG